MTAIRAAVLALFVVSALVVTGGLLAQYPRETMAGSVPFVALFGGWRGLLVYRARQSRRRPARAERNEGNDGMWWSH
jgi:hypothetical protein